MEKQKLPREYNKITLTNTRKKTPCRSKGFFALTVTMKNVQKD